MPAKSVPNSAPAATTASVDCSEGRVDRFSAAPWVSDVDLKRPPRECTTTIAADHRQAGVGAVEAHMLGAVGVDDDVARVVVVVDRSADRAARDCGSDRGRGRRPEVACIGGDRFADAERDHRCQRQQPGLQRHERTPLRWLALRGPGIHGRSWNGKQTRRRPRPPSPKYGGAPPTQNGGGCALTAPPGLPTRSAAAGLERAPRRETGRDTDSGDLRASATADGAHRPTGGQWHLVGDARAGAEFDYTVEAGRATLHGPIDVRAALAAGRPTGPRIRSPPRLRGRHRRNASTPTPTPTPIRPGSWRWRCGVGSGANGDRSHLNPQRRGAAASSPGARSGRCSRRDSAAGSPGARVRLPRNRPRG